MAWGQTWVRVGLASIPVGYSASFSADCDVVVSSVVVMAQP